MQRRRSSHCHPLFATGVFIVLYSAVQLCSAALADDPQGRLLRLTDSTAREKRSTQARVTCLAFSENSTRLVVGNDAGEISIVDLRRQKRIRQFQNRGGEIRVIAFRERKLGFLTIAKGRDEEDWTLSEWGVDGREPIELEHAADSRTASPAAITYDGKLIGLTGWSGEFHPWDNVFIYDSVTKQRWRGLRVKSGVDRIAFSSDNRNLLCVTRYENAVQMWDLEKSERLWSRRDDRVSELPVKSFQLDGSRYAACLFGPDERSYTIAITDGWAERVAVCINDLETGENRHELSCCGDVIAVSRDGQWLAAGGRSKVEIWNAGTGQLARELPGPFDEVRSLTFSADSRLLASGEEDGTVTVWELTTAGRNHAE